MASSSGICVACGARNPAGAPVRRWATHTCHLPLVGRAVQLGRLRARAAEVRRGLGRAVWLEGEAGLGKSRLKDALVEELVATVRQMLDGRAAV